MRDGLIHFYFGVDTKPVWTTIHHHLPELKYAVHRMLKDLHKEKK